MRRAALLLLGLLCVAAAYGLGYLLTARIAPPVGRRLLLDAVEFFGFGGMFRLDGPTHRERSLHEKTSQAV